MPEPLPVELMNTIQADRHGVHDTLTSADELSEWLASCGVTAEPNAAELAGFRSLRDALRVLAATVTDDTRPIASRSPGDAVAASEVISAASALAPPWSVLEWDADGPRSRTRSNGTPASTALSRIAGRAAELFGSSERDALRACTAPGCVRYFVHDHPRREWCSPACGNRARVARHYEKHRNTSSRATSVHPGRQAR